MCSSGESSCFKDPRWFSDRCMTLLLQVHWRQQCGLWMSVAAWVAAPHVARAAGCLNTWRMEGLGIRWNFLEFPGRLAEDALRHAISHALPSRTEGDGSADRPQIAPHGCVPWCRDA